MDDGAPISPLALMDESRPESWLGNFLTMIGAPPALQYNTLKAARADDRLRAHLQDVWTRASQDNPSLLLDPASAAALKDKDWGAWWRGQELLGRYAYSTLALAMLDDRTHMSDLVALYRQQDNARIKKDAHYVVTFLLGKPWPSYSPTERDLSESLNAAVDLGLIGRSTYDIRGMTPLATSCSWSRCAPSAML